MPGADNVASDNHGRHVIHTGEACASYLQLPVKANAAGVISGIHLSAWSLVD